MGRLREAIRRLNPAIPEEAREEALAQGAAGGDAFAHADEPRLSPDAARRRRGGVPRGPMARSPATRCGWSTSTTCDANDWLAVNQFTVIEGQHNRRPDVVLFVNGLPLGGDRAEERGRRGRDDLERLPAAPDLQGADSRRCSHYNAAAGRLRRRAGAHRLADGRARSGSSPGARSTGESDAPTHMRWSSRCWCEGVFERRRFLDLLRHFIVFEEDPDGGALHKKMAGYHQFHAVNVAVEETLRASGMAETAGARRARHLLGGPHARRQAGRPARGRGLAHAGLGQEPDDGSSTPARVILQPAMENPTLVVLTDRNDLDDQLFGTFARCHDLLRQTPVQAESRDAAARSC